MKKETRATLVCRKEMSNGQIDKFEVVVNVNEKSEKKSWYEDMGYSVSVKNGV